MQNQLIPVPFHGETLMMIDHDGEPFAAVKPACENLGLAWQPQQRKLDANKDRWTVTMMVIVSADGKHREMLAMPLRKFPAWINSIEPRKVKPELRAKLELYQNESDDALWDYWTKGQASRGHHDHTLSATLTPAQYQAERDRIEAMQARLAATPITIMPAHYEQLTGERVCVGKKTWLIVDLVAVFEEHNVPREVTEKILGIKRPTIRQHAFRAKNRKTGGEE
jgi:hypothetical protein